MIIHIFGKKYRVPEHPNEISFGDYISINTYIADKKVLTYQDKVAILTLLTRCPQEELDQVIEEDINHLFSKITYLNSNIPVKSFNTFMIGNDKFSIKDLNNLTVKEYVDIDYHFKEGDTVYENLDKVFSVVMRKILSENKTLRNILISIKGMLTRKKGLREYKTKVVKHEELQDSNIEPYSDIIYTNFTAQESIFLLNEILKVRNDLQDKYKMVFESNEGEAVEKSEKLSVAEIWGWYHTLNCLVDNDKQKLDYWYIRPIEELLTHLAYQKQLSLEQTKI